MEQEKQMDEHESLLIIQQMIDTAKQEQKDDGKGWIIWGWMLFLSSVLTVLNMRFNWLNAWFFWDAFGIVTLVVGVYEVVTSFFIKKKQKVRTYTKEIFDKLNVGFFITLVFIIVAINAGVGPVKGFPLLMGLYGFWILIYGAILNFRPSMIGAFITWALAYTALFTKSFEVVMILHAIGVLFGYIIPGHIANKKFKELSVGKSNNKNRGV
jgi:hypothetical protein